MENKINKFKPKIDIEALGDYSFELLDEVSRFIGELGNSQFITSNKFIDIYNKLEKAKSLGVNVKKYEEQIYVFRCSLIHRKISDKINIIKECKENNNQDQSIFDISSIKNNYGELKMDYNDTVKVDEIYQELIILITQTKIGKMIEDYISGKGNSAFDFENIINELEKAKNKGIDTKELEMQMLGE